MIQAMIFDLDGTLVQTERLKAVSYARAAVELCPRAITEDEVVEAFKDVVGRSRRDVAIELMDRFHLGPAAEARMEEFGVTRPWQAFVQVRLGYYDDLVSDPEVLRANEWPHNVELLRLARATGCHTALATTSRCEQTRYVLEALGLADAFDFIVTADDVENTKPDPEAYELVGEELGVAPDACLVIEDSPTGIRAALAAGMWCIAVTTPFTREQIHAQDLLDGGWVVDDPDRLLDVVNQMVEERGGK